MLQDRASRQAHRLCLEASAHQPSEVQPRHLHLGALAAQHLDLEVLARQPSVLQALQALALLAQALPASLAAHLPLEQPARQPSALQVGTLEKAFCPSKYTACTSWRCVDSSAVASGKLEHE